MAFYTLIPTTNCRCPHPHPARSPFVSYGLAYRFHISLALAWCYEEVLRQPKESATKSTQIQSTYEAFLNHEHEFEQNSESLRHSLENPPGFRSLSASPLFETQADSLRHSPGVLSRLPVTLISNTMSVSVLD